MITHLTLHAVKWIKYFTSKDNEYLLEKTKSQMYNLLIMRSEWPANIILLRQTIEFPNYRTIRHNDKPINIYRRWVYRSKWKKKSNGRHVFFLVYHFDIQNALVYNFACDSLSFIILHFKSNATAYFDRLTLI